MKRLLHLVVIMALATMPVYAGVSVSVRVGGGFGGYHGGGGFHGSSVRCYPGGFHGYYGGYGYPSYGYVSYGAPIDYGYSDYSYPSTYGPDPSTAGYMAEAPAPAAPAPAPPVSPASSSLPLGKIDEAGYIHSPFTTSVFKPETVADGQTFYDPVTGQAFTVHKADATPKPPATTSLMPAGRIDEFGYIHSPYSTFTVKAKSDTSAQVYHDPNTGQFFTAVPKITSTHVASAQAVD